MVKTFLAGLIIGALIVFVIFLRIGAGDKERIAELEQRVTDTVRSYDRIVSDTELLHRRMANEIRGLRSEIESLIEKGKELRRLQRRIRENQERIEEARIRIRGIIERQREAIKKLPEEG